MVLIGCLETMKAAFPLTCALCLSFYVALSPFHLEFHPPIQIPLNEWESTPAELGIPKTNGREFSALVSHLGALCRGKESYPRTRSCILETFSGSLKEVTVGTRLLRDEEGQKMNQGMWVCLNCKSKMGSLDAACNAKKLLNTKIGDHALNV